MAGLSRSPAAAEARRQKYYALRRAGLDKWDAAAQVGMYNLASIARYERWFEAVERGETMLRDLGGTEERTP